MKNEIQFSKFPKREEIGKNPFFLPNCEEIGKAPFSFKISKLGKRRGNFLFLQKEEKGFNKGIFNFPFSKPFLARAF